MRPASFLAGFVVFLMIFAFVPAGVVSAADPDEVWVSPDYDGDTEGWDETHFASIQDAIDAVAVGGIIYVFPGEYTEIALRTPYDNPPDNAYGMYVDKDGVSIIGVNESGEAIDCYTDVEATVIAGARTDYGAMHFIAAKDVTITGLRFEPKVDYSNKTLEISGDNFFIQHCVIVDAIYFNEVDFDDDTNTSSVQSFTVTENHIVDGSLTLAGVGYGSAKEDLQITNNLFEESQFGIVGEVSSVGWYVYPVGNPYIRGNTFENTSGWNIFQWAADQNLIDDWPEIIAGNTFKKLAVIYNPDGDVRIHAPDGDSFVGLRTAIQATVSAAVSGDTIYIGAGTYVEEDQIVIDKDLTIIGEDKDTTIIKPAQNTGSSGDARGWFLVEAGNEFNLSNVTLDGEGKAIYQAIRTYGTGTIDNNIFKNFTYSSVMGYGIAAFANVTVSNNHFSNIARVGVVVFGEAADDFLITGNTYVGKGDIVGLDYGIEISAGAQGTITGNTISNCWGIASDGSKSAAIMVTELFGAGTDVVIEGNTLSNNIIGVGVGYGEGDESRVAIADNIFTDNEWHVWGASSVNVDFPVVHDENTFDFSALILEDRIIVGNIDEVMARADYSEDIFDARMPGLQLVFPLSIVPGEPTSIDMSIEVNEDPADPPSGFKFLGNVFTLTMTVDGDPVTEFDGTFTLTLFYDPAEVDDLEMLDIYWYDPDAEEWVALGGTVDTAANSVTVEIDHFSDFVLMEEEAPVLEPEPETPETGTSVMLLIPFGLLLMLAGAFVIRKRVLA